ncbi:class 1 isoprenoid biosynthesis enzyme [Sporolactobacillus shoreicorticis]|uniref:Class 1 isoprenoid biosynthesis enzyme n=1 Tax=Sporolactobacillus shoreicorticis TaxID=1923877 RepID=A0ABW5S6Q4_9BACL|nr:class 1 isoprenoid biosynthesis enzyme [Sporolactobacillus shoreicorticis]MCO7125634.1 class 1 isoprenoid biosynthesis enzyme [Sporolactobacillus shoreicorticis]
MPKKTKTILEISLILITLLSCFVFAYRTLGNPVGLHHTVIRIFDDHVDVYHIKDGVMTIRAEAEGWDGSGWSQTNAHRDGLRKINKLHAAVIDENYPVRQINVMVTYYGKKEIERTLYIK